MYRRRVVITGFGAVSPLGCDVSSLWSGLLSGSTAVRIWPVLSEVRGLRTTIAACVPELDGRVIDRKKRRYMSKMSIYAAIASLEAVSMSGLGSDVITGGRTGVCMGSTTGSTVETESFFTGMLRERSIQHLKSTHFFKIMNSSCAANVSQTLGVTGRLLAPSAACATSTVAVGLGAETIASGSQDVMICGGADELHPLTVGVFDTLEASSRSYNDRPEQTPRPFDADRDGIICGEGAGVLVLESMEHAMGRGADILGEVCGFEMNSSPEDIANPSVDLLDRCMSLALSQSGFSAPEVGYVNAHATGTVQGDEAEARAIERVFGCETPVSSLKGHMGHTMAACGALEIIASILMMREGVIIPTRNLDRPDDVCGRLNLLQSTEQRDFGVSMINSFALGGINSAMVISRRTGNDG